MSIIRKLFSLVAPTKVVVDHPATVSPTVSPTVSATVPATVTRTGPTIAIVNKCTVLTDPQVALMAQAIQIQIDRDFAPVWQTSATLVILSANSPIPSNAWVVYILDTSDQAGALGYHDLTETSGLPIGKIFAGDDAKYGLSSSVTLSHEILEMLADPYITSCVFDQTTNNGGRLYALEVCDATEDDQFGYKINDILVSDFVYPAWFEGFRTPNSTQFSFGAHVSAPFMLAQGGYVGIFDIPNTNGWQQLTPDTGISKRLASKGPYSRKARRFDHSPKV